ncbi:MAG: hypothetical protein ACOZQL_15490 [Myxococcota bacterium]
MVAALLIAAVLGAEPPRTPAPQTPAGVQVAAWLGATMITLGIAVEFTGQAGLDPRAPVTAWAEAAPLNIVGGFALIGAGLGFVTIAAVRTPWRAPPLALWLDGHGGGLVVRWALP